MKRGIATVWTLVTALVLVLAGALPVAAATQVRFAITQDEGTLNPYTYQTGYPGHNLLHLVYDGLMQIDADGIPQPWLATSVESAEGGKVWKVVLDEKAKWHDGKPVTVDDVRFTFTYPASQEGTHSRWSPIAKSIAKIETPDAKTVVFTLNTPNASFNLRLADIPIFPKHIWEGQKEPRKFENSIGSGPYKVAQVDKDKFYKLEANADYFKGKPTVDTLYLEIIKDANAMFTALRAGQVDAISRPLQPELVSQFEATSTLKTIKGPGFTSTILLFNTEKAPFNKKEFRQAVDFAVDKKKLVDTVILGQGVAANNGFVHPELPWANKDLRPAFDQAKARQLLDGLGMKDTDNDGFRENADGSKLDIPLMAPSNNPLRIRAAELIAADLKAVGIKATVKTIENTTLVDSVWKDFDVSKGRNFDMSVFGWSAPVQTDPGRLPDLVHSDHKRGTINLGAFKHPEIDRLGETLMTESDTTKRYELNRQLQKLMADEVPFMTLWFPADTYAYNPKAYEGWVYTKGQSILSKISFFPPAKKVEAAPQQPQPAEQPKPETKQESQESTASRSSGLLWFLGIAAVAVAGLLMVRRKGAAK